MRSARAHVALLVLGLVVGRAAAEDRPLAGDMLRLRDPAVASGRRLLFRADRDPALATALGSDPRTTGATLVIAGTGTTDGSSGELVLPAKEWGALGKPAGSKGFRFFDRGATTGIRRIVLRTGRGGGSLAIAGGGAAWPYRVAAPQETIDVRLTIGADVVCARFTTFQRDARGRVVARHAAAPPDCTPPALRCGDGTLDVPEECDDGNRTSGDGCSADCRLETAAALCAGVPAASGGTLRAVRIATGLDHPVFVTAAPLDPNRLFVVEQPGRIRIVRGGVVSATFLAIEGKVAFNGERGLLSMAFHPRYRDNGRFFVYYVNLDGDLVIARYHVGAPADVADASSEQILLTVPHPSFGNHNGGQLAFGPDRYLYAGTGDGGSGGDPPGNAQNGGRLLGKLLRLDVDVETAPYYAVPPTNPFVGPGDPRDEIWAIGLRNPWRFSFDRGTGDLYIGDVGQDLWEEVDVQPAASAGGENYGWNVFEANHCFAGGCPDPPTGFTFPVVEYSHDDGCSITGGFVYRGCAMPDLRGTYFYSDYCTPFFLTFQGLSGQNPGDRTAELRPAGIPLTHVVTFGEDARGEVYFADLDGDVFQIVPGS